MKFDHSFNHHDVSQALINYVEEKMTRLKRYEIKPCNVHVRYTSQRHLCHIEIQLAGGEGRFHAQQDEKDWYVAVDGVVQKIETQMKKLKNKIKDHKHPHESKIDRYHVDEVEEENEFDDYEDYSSEQRTG